MKVHLVLASGGVKTLSYLGAIEALRRLGVEIETISACSAGSMVGACVSSGADLLEVQKKLLGIKLARYFAKFSGGSRFTWLWRWPFAKYPEPRTSELFQDLLGKDPKFSELEIPFATMAVNLNTAKLLVYSRVTTPDMAVSEAVKVATAIPPLFPARERGHRLLVDGVIVSECPVWLALEYPEEYPIVALAPLKHQFEFKKNHLPALLRRVFEIAGTTRDLYLTDQMIRVHRIEIDCGDVESEDFDIGPEQMNRLFEQGRAAILNNRNLVSRMEAAPLPPDPKVDDDRKLSDDDKAEWGAYRIISQANSRMSYQVRNQVFISYAHEDGTQHRDKLKAVLAPLQDKYKFGVWDDSKIKPGEKWREAIQEAMEHTRVAVLLVSANYLQSPFIKESEMRAFLHTNRIKLLWVASGHSLWRETALEQIQCANDPDMPLKALSDSDLDLQLTNIASQIKTALGL